MTLPKVIFHSKKQTGHPKWPVCKIILNLGKRKRDFVYFMTVSFLVKLVVAPFVETASRR